MIWSIAWRNVWRSKLRSIVVISAIAVGLMAGVFTTAFMKGWMDQRMDDVLLTELAHIQVHKPKFTDNYEFSYFMENADKLESEIKKLDYVEGVSKRIVVNSMISSSETGSGGRISGVIPEEEKKVSNIYEHLVEGNYFAEDRKNAVVIGKKLADKLNVGLRNKIVITLQDLEGNVTHAAFRVVGIYKTTNTSFDGSNIYVRYDDLARVTSLPTGAAQEIAVLLDGNEFLQEATEKIATLAPEMETKNWKSLSPEMAYFDEMMAQYMYIIIIIILLTLCFGIINTMLMVVLERVKELGMLMAVGMNKTRVFFMLMLETVFLTFSGGIVGIILGYILTLILGKYGINFSMWAEGLEEMGFSAVIYPEMDYANLGMIIILVILTGIISAIYPALKALKLNPSEAIRTE